MQRIILKHTNSLGLGDLASVCFVLFSSRRYRINMYIGNRFVPTGTQRQLRQDDRLLQTAHFWVEINCRGQRSREGKWPHALDRWQLMGCHGNRSLSSNHRLYSDKIKKSKCFTVTGHQSIHQCFLMMSFPDVSSRGVWWQRKTLTDTTNTNIEQNTEITSK